MNSNALKGYLKHDLSGIIISVVFFVVLYFVAKDKLLIIFFAGIGLFDFIIKGFSAYKKKQEYLKELTAQGLTEEQANNNSFLINWEKVRKGGMLKYCLWDGGILMGFGLALFVGVITFLIELFFFQLLGDGILFIEFCGSIGIFLGIVLSFFMWSLNEKKFTRLKALLH